VIVVTGGAGFIGSNVVAAIESSSNTEITICDWVDGAKRPNIATRRVKETVSPDAFFEFLGDARTDIELVIHMGANSSTTDPDVDQVLRYNLEFSDRLWRWCAASAVRLIYASSASTYGDGGEGFEDREDREFLLGLRPLNAYGISKHAFDLRVARSVAGAEPAPPQWAGLKFFNVYGPNEYHKGDMQSLVAKMAPVIEGGGTVKLFRSHKPDYRDGEQLRDFVYVKDAVSVVEWLRATPGISGLFNVGSGRARSFLDLAHAIFAALDLPPAIEFVDMPEHLRERYQYFTEAPLGKLRAAGYTQPATSLEAGVSDYVRTYLRGGLRYA
jgi:ADP-L-glycero-D-manno-heptose 6-epimerase